MKRVIMEVVAVLSMIGCVVGLLFEIDPLLYTSLVIFALTLAADVYLVK